MFGRKPKITVSSTRDEKGARRAWDARGTNPEEGEGRAFRFSDLDDVDDATIDAFFASTHEGSRRIPLLVAGYVANKFQDRFMGMGRMDALEMSEIRGAQKALRWFATLYQNGVAEWQSRRERKGDA